MRALVRVRLALPTTNAESPKIPVSAERQEKIIRNQIAEITEGIKSLNGVRGSQFSVKQLEKTKRNLEAKLNKLLNSPKRDNVVTFEELGIDKMFVDEAHNFKNLVTVQDFEKF